LKVTNVDVKTGSTFLYKKEAMEAMQEYAELYHAEQRKKECHCGGYPDCICNLESDHITIDDLKDLDQQREDYYNRDKLCERK
jgi:hypothetical protein